MGGFMAPLPPVAPNTRPMQNTRPPVPGFPPPPNMDPMQMGRPAFAAPGTTGGSPPILPGMPPTMARPTPVVSPPVFAPPGTGGPNAPPPMGPPPVTGRPTFAAPPPMAPPPPGMPHPAQHAGPRRRRERESRPVTGMANAMQAPAPGGVRGGPEKQRRMEPNAAVQRKAMRMQGEYS